MNAREVPIVDLIRPYKTDRPALGTLVGLQARLSLLRHSLEEYDAEWRRFLETPFDGLVAEGSTIVADPCDRCGAPSVDGIARYRLRFCRRCGTDSSLLELLEDKYGVAQAKQMLEHEGELGDDHFAEVNERRQYDADLDDWDLGEAEVPAGPGEE